MLVNLTGGLKPQSIADPQVVPTTGTVVQVPYRTLLLVLLYSHLPVLPYYDTTRYYRTVLRYRTTIVPIGPYRTVPYSTGQSYLDLLPTGTS
eukprot:COSAG01_NODE_6957_length_3417_cov_9.172393_2_plen_92_part_00